jgi:excinuclease UvrABC nuclease subunit
MEKIEHIVYSESPYVYNDVIIGYPFNLYEAVSVYGREIIPEKPGIYHLFYNELLVYVGMSKNLRGRLTCHLKDDDMPFNNVLWFCDGRFHKEDGEPNVKELIEIEYTMIKKLKPSLNTQYLNSQSYGKSNT